MAYTYITCDECGGDKFVATETTRTAKTVITTLECEHCHDKQKYKTPA